MPSQIPVIITKKKKKIKEMILSRGRMTWILACHGYDLYTNLLLADGL
jgi:hypothetical protein